MVEHVLDAVLPVEGFGTVILGIFETQHNRDLHAFCVGDSFEVGVHEERWVLLHPFAILVDANHLTCTRRAWS